MLNPSRIGKREACMVGLGGGVGTPYWGDTSKEAPRGLGSSGKAGTILQDGLAVVGGGGGTGGRMAGEGLE